MLRSCFIGFLFLLTLALPAQSPATLKKNGEKAFENGRWADALAQLDQYQQVKPGDFGVLTRLGICHYNLHHGEKAREYLEYVAAKNPGKPDPESYYYLARTLHGLSEFNKAADAYKQFLRVADNRHPLRANAADNILRCLNGATLVPDVSVALVENLGDRVNTPEDEFAPLPSVNHPDRLYFSSSRPECNGGKRNDQGYEDLEAGHWCADMFYAQQLPGGWEVAGALNGLINSPRHEVALDFGQNGKVLYFFRGFTLFSGDILADTAEIKDEYRFDPPGFSGPVRGENGDGSLFFFNDSTLLFSGRREGGYGGLDLYLTRLHNGAWSDPVNLGPEINSPYDETTPFLALDGRTLYFSSNRLESMGELDIFRAVYADAVQAWQKPVNLGPPVNSPGDDAWFRLSADGFYAFFSSGRLDNFGKRDLFVSYFMNALPEQSAPGVPPLFADAKAAAAIKASNAVREFAIPELYYTDDKDLTGPENEPALNLAAEAFRVAPTGSVVVTVHTDVTGPAKFDLYHGIKRAEIVGKSLIARGIAPERIVLRSAGPAFPAARTVVGAEEYPAGAMLNRRVEIRLAFLSGRHPLNVSLLRREIPEAAKAAGAARFDDLSTGLVFKVDMAAARQIITTDALSTFEEVLIETQPDEGVYHYTAGNVRTFAEAAKLRKEAQNAGFMEAVVAAYVDGLRINKADAVGLIKKYPELANFVKG